jgi:hypothetical protein
MSVDDRLREGLARNASAYEPDVEARLRELRTRRRGASRHAFSKVVWVPIAAACAVAALVVTAIAFHASRPAPEATHVPPTTPGTQSLHGRLRATIPDAPGVVRTGRLAGPWVLRLAPDGTMRVTAPGSYGGVLSAALFDSTSTGFRTSLFGQDLCSGLPLGRYTWQRSGHEVRFTVADDRCAGRVAVLTTSAWRMP